MRSYYIRKLRVKGVGVIKCSVIEGEGEWRGQEHSLLITSSEHSSGVNSRNNSKF